MGMCAAVSSTLYLPSAPMMPMITAAFLRISLCANLQIALLPIYPPSPEDVNPPALTGVAKEDGEACICRFSVYESGKRGR